VVTRVADARGGLDCPNSSSTLSDTQKAVRLLRETLVEIEEFEKQLATAEKAAGLGYAPKMPIIERMVRLGCSKAACDRVAEALTLMSTLERGRPLPGQLRTLLAEQAAAEQSADSQLAAIVKGHKPPA
jgi:hypothetical protein